MVLKPKSAQQITDSTKNGSVRSRAWARSELLPLRVSETAHFLGGRSSCAIRHGDWKLIEFFDTQTTELFNLAHDSAEKQDLADEHPDRVAELTRRLTDWRRDVANE